MSNETISVPRELLERVVESGGYVPRREQLRALLVRDLLAQPAEHIHEWDINDDGTATVCYCGARSSEDPAEQHQGEPVAYVDHSASGGVRWRPGELGKCCDGMQLYTRPGALPAQKYDETLLPFVALMRKELHANAGKGDRPGWLSMSSDTCLLEIIYHFGKLQASVKRGDGEGMAEYAADVANMCMMLLDICGVLAFVEQSAPAAVVLPERKAHRDHGLTAFDSESDGWNACLDEVARLNPPQQ